MKIEFNFNQENIDLLTKKINEEFCEYGIAKPFGFFIRNNDGQVIAGCNGYTLYGGIYTDQLWVHRDYRKQGYGQELMNSVHSHGINSNCSIATVFTMDFQGAVNFYRKFQYEVEFETGGYIQGSKCLFLKKNLCNV